MPAPLAPNAPDHAVIEQSFSVPYTFPVAFTHDAFAADNTLLRDLVARAEPQKRHRIFIALDEGVLSALPSLPEKISGYFAVHAATLEQVGAIFVVPAGEAAKTDEALVQRLHAQLHAQHIDRHSFVLIIGGGGVLDAVGFAANTCHRGVRVFRMPTTVLAQNDSGVGVKSGVNAFGVKNFCGSFAPPYAVLNDAVFLRTLPMREKRAGQAEAVKVSLIRDAAFFEWLESQSEALAAAEAQPLGFLIRRCAELHLRHIATSGDPFEMGSSRPLDFGHWSAHKLESLTHHELRHGEAVALGVLLDSRYSYEVGLLSEPTLMRIADLLGRLGLPRWHPALDMREPNGRRALLRGLDDFREHLGGELTVTLLTGLGEATNVHVMDEAKIEASLAWMRAKFAPL